ncbi:hypothetical protein R8871_02538 [Paraburkholderia graminis C4D1M]|uniref:Uncharacterized protein n=1 Tax=Paraburkholderia graminis (strain ATCC 700544 / DSM 17151 / LMG 18924 / NCIMB 13744 / C4D1M) TaxID=396598 RepID=B1G5M1_PARG4|nr:hypothetical protein [Paraburkholderia graminis]EDT08472.1 hypothetical protein BgramDRAFT_4625 [Paraburkholderia graminis C4D1M]CAB3681538.1 hypothetical protein R8871_02538 [Paraburkholderia graminis C4D1M]
MNRKHLTNHALAARLRLSHDNERLREALALISDIAHGSTTANSLPNIARIARGALTTSTPPDNFVDVETEV